MGVSHDRVYHCECEALTDLKVRILRKNVASADVFVEPEFCELLMKQMAIEMTGMQEHFMMLGRKSATEKLASFLVALLGRVGADKYELKLSMSRADIADFLGLTIETVSRTFSKLRKLGVIDLVDAQTVRVLKIDDLNGLAETKD